MSLGSSVSKVSDYRLVDRGAIPGKVKGFFSSFCVQSSSEVYPASYPMGNGGPYPEVNSNRGVTLTTHPPSSAESRMSRNYISSPLVAFMVVAGKLYILLYISCSMMSRSAHECQTIWAFKEEHSLWKGVLRRILDLTMELTNGQTKLYSDSLHNLNHSSNIKVEVPNIRPADVLREASVRFQ
jgi:hypothetical protein